MDSSFAAVETQPKKRPDRWRWAIAGGVILSLAGVGLTLGGAMLLRAAHAPQTPVGLRLLGQPLSPSEPRGPALSHAELPARVHALSERFLAQTVDLAIPHAGESFPARLSDLGLRIDEARMIETIRRLGHSGDWFTDIATYIHIRRHGQALLPTIELDDEKALDFLEELKDKSDRGPESARLDLEHRGVAPAQPGHVLRIYDSLVALQYATRAIGGTGLVPKTIPLYSSETGAKEQAKDLAAIDVSTVLGTWETRYSNVGPDSDRTYNLKVGAEKLNGYVIRPGAVFSFNGAVGNRSEREGYRVAPVIAGGELVDGLAGGMCQIASTLHAAAFFAGMDIVQSTPHSRPSSYISMGLDSTVVWPSVDLKLKNPFPFPLVLHYTVNQGLVRVEILGKERPNKIAFEREILSESSFGTEYRQDPTMPAGQKLIDQEGYPGYVLRRRRLMYTGKWRTNKEGRGNPEGLVAKREWSLGYPATSQIIRVGTGPTNLKPKPQPPAHRIPPLPKSAKPLFQIVR